jgi:hypothetical protein
MRVCLELMGPRPQRTGSRCAAPGTHEREKLGVQSDSQACVMRINLVSLGRSRLREHKQSLSMMEGLAFPGAPSFSTGLPCGAQQARFHPAKAAGIAVSHRPLLNGDIVRMWSRNNSDWRLMPSFSMMRLV